MPIEYEMMLLKREVEAAISRLEGGDAVFSDDLANRLLNYWESQDPELAVLTDSQRAAINEVRRRGYWLKMDESSGRPILYRLAND